MLTRTRKVISEITDVSRWSNAILSAFGPLSFTGLRSKFRVLSSKYWGGQPAFENTIISYDVARQLYRNDGPANLGSVFCKPIVDLQVQFMGLPSASVEDEIIDDRLNTCLHTFWADEIQQMLRDAIRDSKVIVRITQPSGDDPLMTAEEREHCQIECIVPERVMIFRDLQNKNVIRKATVSHTVLMIEDDGDIANGISPKEKEHEIIELIDQDSYRYWDSTDEKELVEWNRPNTWGFVPLLEVWNEFDASLNGGQSDLESVYPFVRAFHDVLGQSLQAHKYHSTPKVVFHLSEIGQFLKNNFPDVFDSETGKINPQTEISWTGKESIYIQADEKLEFLEAKSVLGDSEKLLNFLFQCICVASETPPWAFMKVDIGTANQAQNAQTVPFTKKILKKRTAFQKPISDLLKMYLKIIGLVPIRPSISWDAIQPQDQVMLMTALQQLIMGLEVAAQRGIISDTTYREMLRVFIPMMKNPTDEAEDAKDNVTPAIPAGTEQVPASSNGKGKSQNVPVTAGQQGRNE